VPGAAAGFVGALGLSPTGEVLLGRVGFGDLLTLDPATGALTPSGGAYLGEGFGGEGGPPSFFLSMGFGDDGTIVLPDFGQLALVEIAP